MDYLVSTTATNSTPHPRPHPIHSPRSMLISMITGKKSRYTTNNNNIKTNWSIKSEMKQAYWEFDVMWSKLRTLEDIICARLLAFIWQVSEFSFYACKM